MYIKEQKPKQRPGAKKAIEKRTVRKKKFKMVGSEGRRGQGRHGGVWVVSANNRKGLVQESAGWEKKGGGRHFGKKRRKWGILGEWGERESTLTTRESLPQRISNLSRGGGGLFSGAGQAVTKETGEWGRKPSPFILKHREDKGLRKQRLKLILKIKKG